MYNIYSVDILFKKYINYAIFLRSTNGATEAINFDVNYVIPKKDFVNLFFFF